MPATTILIDTVIFQIQSGGDYGIARIWRNVIPLLQSSMPHCRFVLLQRGNHAHGMPGFETISAPPYRFHTIGKMDQDESLVREICLDHDVDIFMSSYYTRAPGFFTVQIAYDMIPEIFKWDTDTGMWCTKKRAFSTAQSCIAISQSTRKDLCALYGFDERSVGLAYPGVSPVFTPAPAHDIVEFRRCYELTRPYFLMVGYREEYKNAETVYKAFQSSPRLQEHFQLVTVGGAPENLTSSRLPASSIMHLGKLSDAQLRLAYSGARAFVYPSRYEGFGIPIIEAYACGCPVIAANTSSLPEAGGDACLYASPDSPEEFCNAMLQLDNEPLCAELREKGFRHAAAFTWEQMAQEIRQHLNILISGTAIVRHPKLPARAAASEAIFRATSALEQHDTDAALPFCLQALDSDPTCAAAHAALGSFFRSSEDSTKALLSLEKALSLDRFDREYLIAYAEVCRQSGLFGEAAKHLIDYCVYYPDDLSMYELLYDLQYADISSAARQPVIHDSGFRGAAYRITAIITVQCTGSASAPEETVECVCDLELQCSPKDLEIVIVAAGFSESQLVQLTELRNRFGNIRCLEFREPLSTIAMVNCALIRAQGTLVTMLDSSDRIVGDAYAIMANLLESKTSAQVVSGQLFTDTSNEAAVNLLRESMGRAPSTEMSGCEYHDLLFFDRIGPHPLWRRSIHSKIGFFDERYDFASAFDFWLRCGRSYEIISWSGFSGINPGAAQARSAAELKEHFSIMALHQDAFFTSQGTLYPSEMLTHMLKLFLNAFMQLVEINDLSCACEFYRAHRNMFPDKPPLDKFDHLFSRIGGSMLG